MPHDGVRTKQFMKLAGLHGADLMFTDSAIKEIAKVALERGTGARGIRAVIEEVMEGVLFDVEAGSRYVITDKTVICGEAVKQSIKQPRAAFSSYTLGRFRASGPS
jgi:ATP-dependent Clp protease ATP-binding subunit ClpX